MNTCPPEIHAMIFSLACTDDGTMGRSLSLVSRFIRDRSAPFKWQSLSISGPKQARGFVNSLKGNLNRFPLRHLFLSTESSQCATAELRPRVRRSWAARLFNGWIGLQNAILQYAAPTLVTLTLACFDTQAVLDPKFVRGLLAIPLPKLAELSLRVYTSPNGVYDVLPAHDATARNAASLRPELRRFHIACIFRNEEDLHDMRGLVRTISPKITHFRVSMLASAVDAAFHDRKVNMLYSEAVKHHLVVPRDYWVNSYDFTPSAVTWPSILPNAIQMLAFQPPPPLLVASRDAGTHCRKIVKFYSSMERASSGHFIHIPRTLYSYWDARNDWLDRITGGPGCWKQPAEAQPCSTYSNSGGVVAHRLPLSPSKSNVGARRFLFVFASCAVFGGLLYLSTRPAKR
ncbi:hypothetical protein BKA93DRAFT_59067 [Sparassis latifolia]